MISVPWVCYCFLRSLPTRWRRQTVPAENGMERQGEMADSETADRFYAMEKPRKITVFETRVV